MDLLKYLEPMKNLPERFSNLAFWRGVRKLRDEVVNAFEYVDSWGKNIENQLNPKLFSTVFTTTETDEMFQWLQTGANQFSLFINKNTIGFTEQVDPNISIVDVKFFLSFNTPTIPTIPLIPSRTVIGNDFSAILIGRTLNLNIAAEAIDTRSYYNYTGNSAPQTQMTLNALVTYHK